MHQTNEIWQILADFSFRKLDCSGIAHRELNLLAKREIVNGFDV